MNDVKEFRTIRLVFSKTGRARYMSHLDLNRAMIRALRRAKLPVWYTEGFNRHPYVTFAAPLSLGYEGLHETMEPAAGGGRADGGAGLPFGRGAARRPAGALGRRRGAEAGGGGGPPRYELLFSCPACAVRALLERDSLPVQKRTKKKTMRTVDLKPALTASGWELPGGGGRLPTGADPALRNRIPQSGPADRSAEGAARDGRNPLPHPAAGGLCLGRRAVSLKKLPKPLAFRNGLC